jgi:hypothetical protein
MEDFVMTSQVLVEAGFRTPETSTRKALSTTSQSLLQKTAGIPGEHLIGIVFAASALVVGGWFFWTLAYALETYRVY